MHCPYCHKTNDHVVNCTTTADGTTVMRVRECNRCGRCYTTYERIEQTVLSVVKRDGIKEDFSRSKILSDLVRVCHDRPVMINRLNKIVDEIEDQLLRQGEKEVPSKDIDYLIDKKLREIDKVAHMRFALS